jgi:hypothetical protein
MAHSLYRQLDSPARAKQQALFSIFFSLGRLLSAWARVGDKIGSPRPPLTKGEPRVSLTQRLSQAHAAQGGVTLGLEQG